MCAACNDFVLYALRAPAPVNRLDFHVRDSSRWWFTHSHPWSVKLFAHGCWLLPVLVLVCVFPSEWKKLVSSGKSDSTVVPVTLTNCYLQASHLCLRCNEIRASTLARGLLSAQAMAIKPPGSVPWRKSPFQRQGYPPEIFQDAKFREEKYLCPQCHQVLDQPRSGPCGHRYCRRCLEHRIDR